jgi:hypothetical protein
MKTVYRFYKKPSDEAYEASKDDEDLSLEDKYPLYAFTNDKEIRDEFISVRNRERFIEIKSKMERSEYRDFANSNNHQLLKKYKFSHLKEYKDHGGPEIEDIEIVSTWSEKEFIEAFADAGLANDNEGITSETSGDEKYRFFPFMLKEKYVEALSTIEYLNHWKLYGKPEYYYELLTDNEQELMDYSYPSTSYDELNLFILLFGDTML